VGKQMPHSIEKTCSHQIRRHQTTIRHLRRRVRDIQRNKKKSKRNNLDGKHHEKEIQTFTLGGLDSQMEDFNFLNQSSEEGGINFIQGEFVGSDEDEEINIIQTEDSNNPFLNGNDENFFNMEHQKHMEEQSTDPKKQKHFSEEESSNSERHNFKEKLFPSSNYTVEELITSMVILITKCNINKTNFGILLELIHICLPDQHNFFIQNYSHFMELIHKGLKLERYYVCVCGNFCQEKNSYCLNCDNNMNDVIYMRSLENILSKRFENEQQFEKINYFRKNIHSSNDQKQYLNDIYDADFYKRRIEQHTKKKILTLSHSIQME
jgi:hypothetical protein